jgi:four helix bundle protein
MDNGNSVAHFNEKMRMRTKQFAVRVYKVLNAVKMHDLSGVPARQLLRCSSSVAANSRSAARGRSEAEFYAKICIVVEECDESVFWIEYMAETEILNQNQTMDIYKEAKELLCIFSVIKRKIRIKKELS